MRRLILCTVLAAAACKPQGNAASPVSDGPLRTDEDKTLYALGLFMGQRMGDFHLTAAELAIVQRGVRDQVLHNPPVVQLREWGPRLNQLARQRAEHAQEEAQRGLPEEKRRGREFADRAAQEPGAVRLPSGLVFRETRAGNGAQPGPNDVVRVHYRGTLVNGSEFDSTRGSDPAEFPLGGVVPCWTEGIQRMHVGGTARLVCPSDIAYGDRGQREIPPGATLNFEVELIAVVSQPPPTLLGVPVPPTQSPAADGATPTAPSGNAAPPSGAAPTTPPGTAPPAPAAH